VNLNRHNFRLAPDVGRKCFTAPSRFVEVKMSNCANETFGLRPLLAENVCDAFAFRRSQNVKLGQRNIWPAPVAC
jgi:hypothetical protein